MLSHFHLYGELRSSGVITGRRNGPSGLREDGDDDDDVTSQKNKNFARNKTLG